MMNSTIKNYGKKTAYVILPILFWFAVWEIAALIVDNPYFLPSISDTLPVLIKLITGKKFYISIVNTFFRVVSGLFLGTVAGIILSSLSVKFNALRSIITPFVSVIKATPVASFIILLWVNMSGNALTIFIAFLMVFPIMWQNLTDAYSAIDNELSEVCDVFQFSYFKRLKILIIPTLMKYFAPALITSVGLAWKSEIAAEIIAYTKNSIGQYINDAKYAFDTPAVFAWTFVIIVFSITLEKLTRYLLRRYEA